MTVNVTPEFRPLLRDSLVEALLHAAEAVVGCGTDLGGFPVALDRFDRARAALDAVGWGASTAVDVDAHRDVLQAALSDRLGIEQYMRAEQGDHAATQRDRAHKRIVAIECFMRAAGLAIPASDE